MGKPMLFVALIAAGGLAACEDSSPFGPDEELLLSAPTPLRPPRRGSSARSASRPRQAASSAT